MPNYRRPFAPSGTFFFTVVTQDRAELFLDPHARRLLREAFTTVRKNHPFELEAMALLPEHHHSIWTLPPGDTDFSMRWAAIKATFSRNWLAAGGAERAVTKDRFHHGGRGVWQPRFYDHLIRDEEDYEDHFHYLHYNPVKHGRARCPHAWPHSTFGKWVQRQVYDETWYCSCDGQAAPPPEFEMPDGIE